ncbi:SpoIIE family protein phosphatase [Gemmata sp. JC717]|uniref:PP2C family protein-serine/threonine phosphatase n=1 Tax=Gemmata algarum TaxID=2975278 RepID=UPI0021BB613B|nr:SpoIIE family protein phosphatase [Gemmata algarum]MDY3551113.1 SpoIIE family protein phosphatase [Gemmata algarum]
MLTRPDQLSVRQVMVPTPVQVPPSCPLRDVMGEMNRLRIGAVLVTTGGHELQGIFTERDLLRRVADADPGWRELPVSEWMTPDPITIGPHEAWEEAVALMERKRVRHLPVVEGRTVQGLLSTRMLLGRRTDDLNRLVEHRTHELKRALGEIMARDAEMRHNLRAAGRLQTRLLLPHAPPPWPELRWGVHYAPLDHLGGDYYDVAQPDPDHIGFLIADASGHSIAAAMVAIMSRSAFADVAGSTVSPGAVLSEMNARLQGLADDRFVTAFYGVLNRRTRVLTYASAGHPYPLRFVARTGAVQPLSAHGFLLGIVPDEQYRERTVQLEPGDRLCFYTDGLVEARDDRGEGYGTDRLEAAFTAGGALAAEPLRDRLLEDQRAFRGDQKLSDDVTLVVCELARD